MALTQVPKITREKQTHNFFLQTKGCANPCSSQESISCPILNLWCSAWEALPSCHVISHREGMQCWYTGIRVRIRILRTRMMPFLVCGNACIYTLHQSTEDNHHWVAFILCLFPSERYSFKWNCSQCQSSIVRILLSLREKLNSTTIDRILCSHKKYFLSKKSTLS